MTSNNDKTFITAFYKLSFFSQRNMKSNLNFFILEGYNENYVYGLESIFRKDDSKIMQITASLK
jgi:hypothetical protein